MSGKPTEPQNDAQLEAIRIINDLVIARELGYTIEEIHRMPANYYHDFLLIFSLESERAKKMEEERKRKKF